MHGKPKKVEHGIYDNESGRYKPINYQQYNYKRNGAKLDNVVKCFEYDGTNMITSMKQLGVEEDITLDSREKIEHTKNKTRNGNLNAFIIIPIPFAIPFAFGWNNTSETKFNSAAVTKVIQQYGILDNIESYNEGAKTTVYNEIYDALTGQPVVTSINNEFNDREYTTTIPAWWAYKNLSGAYQNIGYTDEGTITIDANKVGTLHISNTTPLVPGDQLAVSYTASGSHYNTAIWVMGKIPSYLAPGEPTCDGINVLPRFPAATPGWSASTTLSDVSIRVINSGCKNMLTDNIETYTSASFPTSGAGILADNLRGLIDLSASTYSDSNTRIFNKYIVHTDEINPYASGERGEWRLLSEYKYQTNRKYASTTSRNAGLYDAQSLYVPAFGLPVADCHTSPYNYLAPKVSDSNWHAMRTITKWSPFGKEVENVDAIGNYSAALFGYNEELPIAVASNARQGEILSLNFEEYNLIRPIEDSMDFRYFTYATVDPVVLPAAYSMYKRTRALPNITSADAHTGLHSYITQNSYSIIPIPVNQNNYSGIGFNYNSYFTSVGTGSGGYTLTSDNEYLGFGVRPGKSYIVSFWVKTGFITLNTLTYVYPGDFNIEVLSGGSWVSYPTVVKTNLIDGWQQREGKFVVPLSVDSVRANFPKDYYIDDLRIFPANGNMKTFVYGPISHNLHGIPQKLMATLDENNFATKYEYDLEGNLVRVKKETSKGIITVSESRSGNPKTLP
jgi:hypothetical protein